MFNVYISIASECHRCTNAKNNGDCNKQMKDTCSAYQVLRLCHSRLHLSWILNKINSQIYNMITYDVIPEHKCGSFICKLNLIQSCETKINRQTKALTKKCTSTSACKTLCHGNSAICTFCCQGDNCNEGTKFTCLEIAFVFIQINDHDFFPLLYITHYIVVLLMTSRCDISFCCQCSISPSFITVF